MFIQSEGKYELEWLKQFNVDKDERFIKTNQNELLCNTIILICSNMKSQNLNKNNRRQKNSP